LCWDTDENILYVGNNDVAAIPIGGTTDAFTVKVDSDAAAGYIGTSSSNGVLQTASPLTYTDMGNYILLDVTDIGDADVVNDLTITSTKKISNILTTEQLRLGYDATNYATFTVADDGALTIATVDVDAAEGDINLAPDGFVGIKKAIPTVELDVTGDILASGTITSTGDVAVGDDVLLADGAVVGITGNEVITFNAAGSINVTGATMDVDGAFTASTIAADTTISGTAITGTAEANFTNNAAAVTFGAVGTDADVVLAFDAVGNQGSLTYMNGEDRFDFDNDVDVIGDLTAATIAADTTISGTTITASTQLELSHASENTLTASSGVLSIEGAALGKVAGQAWSGVHDFGGATTFEIWNSTSDMALGAEGQIGLQSTDDQLVFHGGSAGEIQGEAAKSLLEHKMWSFDPKTVCDGAVDRLFLMTIGDDAPEGIIITEWKVSFEADPTTEVDLDLKYADAFIGVANAAVIDVLDTSAGVSSEDTNANINSGAAVANGKVLYLEFGTAYTETTHQVIFEIWYYAEED